ncbi:Conserved_hypothetical protein [Hexamita inflata]|uniref:Uncharacterized protein n=1 Tax=Hexamita inflata TaxID=28002 RepID=A0AA86NKQ7_9EUKA|nr:Conserved hypothetical protein [Hexamita inflata]
MVQPASYTLETPLTQSSKNVPKRKNCLKLTIIISAVSVSILTLIIVLCVTLPKKSVQPDQPDQPGSPQFKSYLSAKKSLYVWSHASSYIDSEPAWYRLSMNYNGAFDDLISFCKFHGFSKLYLFAGSVEWEWNGIFQNKKFIHHNEFIQQLLKLQQNNIEVELAFYLNDDPNDMSGYEKVVDIANTVLEASKTVKIKAIHFDQECYNKGSYDKLIKMLRLSNAIYPTTSTVKPLWVRQTKADVITSLSPELQLEWNTHDTNQADTNKQYQYFVDLLINSVSGSDMMSYSNVTDTIKTLSNNYFKRVNQFGLSGHPIVETGFGASPPEEETLHYEYVKDNNKFFAFIAEMAQTYKNIVIHDYRQYYLSLYCKNPVEWQGVGVPKVC